MTDLIQFATDCLAVGLTSMWLHPRSKKPIQKGWNTMPTPTADVVKAAYQPGMNLGFRLGKYSPYGDRYIVVMDVDLKSEDPKHQAEVAEAVRSLIGDSPEGPNVLSGGGGQHYYIAISTDDLELFSARKVLAQSSEFIEGRKRAWQVEILGTNAFVVAPGSIHASGKSYVLRHWIIISDMPLAIREVLMREARGVPPIATSMAISGYSSVFSELTRNRGALSVPQDSTEQRRRIVSALEFLEPDMQYQEWFEILFALHSSDLSDAEEIARNWSMKGRKYDVIVFDKTWASYRNKPDGITLGTLFYKAKLAGWVDPEKSIASPGDVANAERFAQQYRRKLLHCHGSKRWYRWDGERWKACRTGEAMEAAKNFAKSNVEQAATALKNDPESSLTKLFMKAATELVGNRKRLESMLILASSGSGMGVADIGVFDADPFLLGCQNGVIDLKTGRLQPAEPELLISKQAAANFNLEAECPQFQATLCEIFQNNSELISYLQRWMGYCLTGCVHEETMHFWYGMGSNGKSLLCNIFSRVLNDYCVQISSDLLLGKNAGSEGARAITRLVGARVAWVNETGEGDVWDDQQIKSVVSTERVPARFLYAESFEFIPTAKIIVRGNLRPVIKDNSHGMWRRITLLSFERKFDEAEQDKGLCERILSEERDGILVWLVNGYWQYLVMGLNPPASVKAATASYRKACDIIGEFLAEEVELLPEAKINKQMLFDKYRHWSEQNGLRPLSQKSFTRKLSERDIGLDAGGRHYVGVRLFLTR